MSYTPPAADAAVFSWSGFAAYTPPAADAADFELERRAWLEVPGPLGAPVLLGSVGGYRAGWIQVPSPLGAPALLADHAMGARLEVPSPLGAPSLLGELAVGARMAVPSPLGAAWLLARHDFTGVLGDAVSRYVMDLVTPGGLVRVPISSWQATLRSDGSNYVQCVVPAVADWVTTINAATEFVITRRAVLPSGQAIEYEMARSPVEQMAFDRGPTNYTATISGYSTGFAPGDGNPPAALDRTLAGVRSISYSGGMRVRCSVDWLLRPGQRAWVGTDTSLVVDYINYYVVRADAYMDVGSSA